MNKPWQIWTSFLMCLAVVVPAMGWLTIKTIHLDGLRETDRVESELARREAELQERISSALYRLDWKLLPLVTQEAARPYNLYQSFYEIAAPIPPQNETEPEGQTAQWRTLPEPQRPPAFSQINNLPMAELPSPLLFHTPEFVLLHFQIGADGTITSPQRPDGPAKQTAVGQFGISPAVIQATSQRMKLAASRFEYDTLIAQCPVTQIPLLTANSMASQSGTGKSVYSVPAVDKLSQQIKENQASQRQQRQQQQFDSIDNVDNAQAMQALPNKSLLQRTRGTSRVNEEFNRRRDSTHELAEQQMLANTYGNQLAIGSQRFESPLDRNDVTGEVGVRQGVMRPIWIGDQLLLVRRIDGVGPTIVQACWLDWESIQKALKAEVADLLPNLEFEGVQDGSDLNFGTALTTIPVQLKVDKSALLPTLAISSRADVHSSGLKLSLWVAWFGLGIAVLASAVLLRGVIRLSERRAAFVSAVTHELRTPLTTFRMYAEMLAEKMVPEGKQQEYAQTLRVQADRLSHLVENVLQFARLERGAKQPAPETLTLEDLFSRFRARLVDRAHEAEMNVMFELESSATEITTQPSTIEQILFNLVDNACKYGKPSPDNRIDVACTRRANHFCFSVRDHGPGVAPQYRKRMFQPFCKSDQDAANSAEGVGLGLALCCRMATALGGRLYHQPCDNGAMFILEVPH